ncbi:hypothetical protein [uncultured Selenomonas sp.]|uniref:hypothetical protein n=1 Tax=uncultured Selenomonas sp. TaxID=159275 RepID=UPI0025D68DBC|nr:hypothetical protein [uncultured Selenomonas sp.]
MPPIDTAKHILQTYSGPPLRLMEVCGTHTHAIFRYGIRTLLPPSITLISGPGCPVCVTPTSYIDEAIYLAAHGVTLTTFGDLLRVPGTNGSLADARSRGARVQIVYTPLDAVTYAAGHPAEPVAFLSVGFETTTPASCLAVQQAAAQGLQNFTLLTANKTMDAAYLAMADACDAYLYPGHVCAPAPSPKKASAAPSPASPHQNSSPPSPPSPKTTRTPQSAPSSSTPTPASSPKKAPPPPSAF